jgi:transposase-like protein
VGEERFRFVQEYQSEEWCMAEVCRRFGICRFTGYKWLERYEHGGIQALEDRSRAPHDHPNQVLEEVEGHRGRPRSASALGSCENCAPS